MPSNRRRTTLPSSPPQPRSRPIPDRFTPEREADRAYEQHQYEREIELEALGMSLPAATVVVTYGPCLPRDEDERIDRDYEAMEREFDHDRYTREGRA